MGRHRGRDGCKVTGVGRDVCYLRFGQRTAVVVDSQTGLSPSAVWRTPRGEELVFDLDAEGNVVGIELVADFKPCQQAAALEGKPTE